MVAVNASITLRRPLLVKVEPGTGKTMLAIEVAKSAGAPLLEWHIKSTTKAQHVSGHRYPGRLFPRATVTDQQSGTPVSGYP